ncbi:MAG: 50S ribosomal protein L6 [Candidatus Zambryskibacteria bacterium]|nr:50S ribosomal protein L6 [Candidatus Zambryskibacteria bacterium]
MSRIGKKEIKILPGTEVSLKDNVFFVKGPKGLLERKFRDDVVIKIEENHINLSIPKENNQTKALWGTYASHIKNMIKGVNDGFEKKLVLEGVGFKSQVNGLPAQAGNKLILSLGFSHPVEVLIPDGLEVKAEKNLITIFGFDKELVGAFTAKVRSLKKPEPYKGKGFRYENEIIRRKQGKKTV